MATHDIPYRRAIHRVAQFEQFVPDFGEADAGIFAYQTDNQGFQLCINARACMVEKLRQIFIRAEIPR
jgi:hypothetical protein